MTEDSRWGPLNALGKRYRDLVNEDHGVPLETRTDEQIEIANTLVEEIYPYLCMLARRTLGYRSVKNSLKNIPRTPARPAVTTVNDLAQEGARIVIERLHTYRPEYAFASFVAWQFCQVARSPEFGLTHVPIQVLNGSFTPKPHANPTIECTRAGALDYAIRGTYDQLPTTSTEGRIKEWSEDAQAHLRNYGHEEADIIEKMDDQRTVERILAHSKDKRNVLRRRFGPKEATLQQIADDNNITREGVRQIEHRELVLARKYASTLATPPTTTPARAITPEMIEDAKEWLRQRNMTKSKRFEQLQQEYSRLW